MCLVCLTKKQQRVTTVTMVLTPEQKQKIYAPYIDLLHDTRISFGITQSVLANVAGLSAKYVTLIEGDQRVPSLDCLFALMAHAGISREKAEKLSRDILDAFQWRR